MKKIVLLLILLFGIHAGAQESISFVEGSYDEILSKAKKENKLIFLDAYASWCGPCKMMQNKVFTDQKVIAYFNEHFINAHFDVEKGEGPSIAKKYGIYSYPTLLFLNANGEIVRKTYGYHDAEQFLALGREINDPQKKGLTIKELFEKGESNPDTLMDFFIQTVNSDYDFAQKVAERYFSVVKKDAFTKQEIMMLVYSIQSANDSNYSYFTKYKEHVQKYVPAKQYEQLNLNYQLQKMAVESVDEPHQKIDEQQYYANAKSLVSDGDAKIFLNHFKLKFYLNHQNYTDFNRTAVEYYGDGQGYSANELISAAFFIAEYSHDSTQIQKAIHWMESLVEKHENPDNTYVLAKLYFLNHQKDKAKMYVEKSLDLFKKEGRNDTVYPEQLLKELSKD